MASRKGLQQLKNAEMRNAPFMKSVKTEKNQLQIQKDKERMQKKMFEKWLMQSRKASTEEKKRMMKEYEQDCERIAVEWRHVA